MKNSSFENQFSMVSCISARLVSEAHWRPYFVPSRLFKDVCVANGLGRERLPLKQKAG